MSISPPSVQGPTLPDHATPSRQYLDIHVLDVLSGAPVRQGGYVKSCTVTCDGQSVHYYCPDKRRQPEAALSREVYRGHRAAEARQRERFYRFASAGLKLLGAWDAEVSEQGSAALGKAIVRWQEPWLDETDQRELERRLARDLAEAVDFVVDKGFVERLQRALAGWDQVDDEGHLRIALPAYTEPRAVRVRLELHDLKYLTDEDVDAAFASLQAMRSAGLASHFHVAYDRRGAPFGGRDPDHPRQESLLPLSNWCIRAHHDPSVVRSFRNFADFHLVIGPTAPEPPARTIYALCYCQPSWHDTVAFHRAPGTSLEQCTTDKRTQRTTRPTLSTTYTGGGTFNHGVYGVLREDARALTCRLHAGLDLAGEAGTTPNFAVKGGRVSTAESRSLGIHHAEEQFTEYDHLDQRFPVRGQWVKAGSLVGMAGRRGIPEDVPTHTHFAVGVDEQVDAADEDALVFAREPGATLTAWAAAQLGDGAAALYRELLPCNASAWYAPPCRGEYRSLKDKPLQCTAACLGEFDSLVAAQVRFAKDCFAIRTNRNPRLCACPGLSERGIESSFNLRQRIQHQLWVAGDYQGAFDGLIERDTRDAILAAAPRLDEFRRRLEQACHAGIPTRQAKSRPWPAEPGLVLAELLRDTDNVKLLLGELERLNQGLVAPQPVARHRRAKALHVQRLGCEGGSPALPAPARAGARPPRRDE